ncbi:MAG: response regulator [Candidatus Hydrogenedentota bacterium]
MSEVQRPQVLIVDDSSLARQITEKQLDSLDVEVLTATSGEEAVEVFRGRDLAIILMDVVMGGIDGFETARRIRDLDHPNNSVPIIFLTASLTDSENVFRGYESGAVDYLLKSVDVKPLCSKVGVFCQLHAQRAEIIEKNRELETYIEEINQLRGLVPICAQCKNVRDDEGFWHSVEHYFTSNSDTEFSHSICPDCREELYPGVGKNRKGIQ